MPTTNITKIIRSQFLLLLSIIAQVNACTNLLVTRGASADGSSMIAYNADSGNLFGYLYHYPAINKADAGESTMRKIYDWDSGAYLGEIPEAPSTYNVVGNTNSMGLTIGETTFGGIEALAHQPGAIVDYGSLIYITLQRAATAREAIQVMTDLMDTYGYASEGESFSLSDSTTGEVWIMEVIGRGRSKKGAVWVAVKIPDGAVAAHANQARITTFPRHDPENCMYAPDVVDLAVEMGLYKRIEGDKDDSMFSFSDVYDPVTYSGARHGDARVWSIFSQIAEFGFEDKYFDYVTGKDLSNRMPLYIIPTHKLSLQDVDILMSSHYENTKLSMGTDVGAGEFATPYRTRPLVWKYEGLEYANERAIATQQTGWNFIAQMRPYSAVETSSPETHPSARMTTSKSSSNNSLPQYISSILWFGADDSSTAPRVPVYGCSTELSPAFSGKGPQDGVTSPLLQFDINKAFWVQNLVSNFVYSRWNLAYPVLKQKRQDVMNDFIKEVEKLDERISMLHGNEWERGIHEATEFTVNAGDKLQQIWWQFHGELFVRFRDFFDIHENSNGGIVVKEVGYRGSWRKRIVDETGDFHEVPLGTKGNDHSNAGAIDDDDGNNNNNNGENTNFNTYVMLRGAMYEFREEKENARDHLMPIPKQKIQGF